jgi:hypothetical protein
MNKGGKRIDLRSDLERPTCKTCMFCVLCYLLEADRMVGQCSCIKSDKFGQSVTESDCCEQHPEVKYNG